MSVYTGWQADLLAAASLPDTAHNRTFLSAWHEHASSDCHLNPVDLTSHNSGSSNCAPTGIHRVSYQAYSGRVWARTAFDAQMRLSKFAGVSDALKSGNPYGLDNVEALVQSIRNWPSPKFADYFAGVATAGGPPATLHAPHALGGWKALRKSINKGMPEALAHAHRVNTATLRSLDRARKVRL